MFFDDEYFKDEIRNDFLISSMMKRAWAAALEVLNIVIEICERNNIQYFADWGTMLGAIRHKGYIPWDDDIDICIKRPDYNRLMKLLPKALPYGYSLAGMYAESERLQNAAFVPHMRVMADETKIPFSEYMRMFHGFPYQRIGIDIFPLDYISDDEQTTNLQKHIVCYGIELLRDWDKLQVMGSFNEHIMYMEQICNIKIDLSNNPKNYIWKVIDSVSQLYSENESEYLTEFAILIENNNFRMKKQWFDEVIKVPFENITVAVPKEYDNVLRSMYGDYMTPVYYAADHDYPFYGHMEHELIRQIKAVGFNGSVEEFCDLVSKGKLVV